MPIPQARLNAPYALIREGKLDQALALARRLMQQHPADPQAAELMRVLSLCRQEFEQAVYHARRLADLAAGDPHARADLAMTLVHAEQFDEGARLMREVADAAPDQEWAQIMHAGLLIECQRFGEAERAARDALARFAHATPLKFRLSIALMEQGRAREAGEVLQQMLIDNRDDLDVAMQMAATALYEHPVDPARLLAAHQNYGRLLDISSFDQPFRHERPPTGAALKRPLRVGFVSADFRRHSVASFIEPLLEHADRARVQPLGFFNRFHGDAVTERLTTLLRRAGGDMHNIAVLDTKSCAAFLHAQRLDVLVDLSGLTTGHRLPALRLKPAPVQITFCGYPATTGLRAIDYRLVDAITDPPGAERWMVERPLRLDPCFLCFRPAVDAPTPPPPPILTSGRPTFGSFNMILKVSDAVIDLWAALLRRHPDARLLMKAQAFVHAGTRDATLARFVARAIDPARVEILAPVQDAGGHFAAYHRVDVALDTFPYTGTTTTCEAIYMGVPVVTLCPPPAQSVHHQRVSASLLSAVGLTELIASTPDAYLDIAGALAADPARLAAYRATLRNRMRASPLCDGPSYAARFVDRLHETWAAWAGGTRAAP